MSEKSSWGFAHTWKIVKCLECGTPQYVKVGQKSRKCPRCDRHLDCCKLKAVATAKNENEAVDIVQTLKTPCEIDQRVYALKRKLCGGAGQQIDKYGLLGNLLTELLYVFPNAMPLSAVLQRAKQVGLDDEPFILKVLEQLSLECLMLRNTDARGNIILKFPMLPLSHGKLYVERPKPRDKFNKAQEKEKMNAYEKNHQKDCRES